MTVATSYGLLQKGRSNMGAYNYKVSEYAHGTKITNYSKPIYTELKKQKRILLTETERTPEMIRHSLQTSLNRTKNTIYELSKSNDWEYFITLTFDPKRYDSTNYDEVTKILTEFMHRMRKIKSKDLTYMIVPEFHADGRKYHFHGLLANIGDIKMIPSGHLDKDANDIYNMPAWIYGFSTATKIKDTVRASAYITKYITKECVQHTKYKKRYYASRNIKRPEVTYINSAASLEEVIATYSPDTIKSMEMGGALNRVTYMEIDD